MNLFCALSHSSRAPCENSPGEREVANKPINNSETNPKAEAQKVLEERARALEWEWRKASEFIWSSKTDFFLLPFLALSPFSGVIYWFRVNSFNCFSRAFFSWKSFRFALISICCSTLEWELQKFPPNNYQARAYDRFCWERQTCALLCAPSSMLVAKFMSSSGIPQLSPCEDDIKIEKNLCHPRQQLSATFSSSTFRSKNSVNLQEKILDCGERRRPKRRIRK